MKNRSLAQFKEMYGNGLEAHKDAPVTVVESETPDADFGDTPDSENDTQTAAPDTATLSAPSEDAGDATTEKHDHVEVDVPSTEEMPDSNEGDVKEDKGEESDAEVHTDKTEVGGDDDNLGEADSYGHLENKPTVSTEQRAYQAVKELTQMRSALEAYRTLIEPTLDTGGITPIVAEAVRIGLESMDEEFGGDKVVPSTEDFSDAAADHSRLTVKTLHRISQGIESVDTAIGNAKSVLDQL